MERPPVVARCRVGDVPAGSRATGRIGVAGAGVWGLWYTLSMLKRMLGLAGAGLLLALMLACGFGGGDDDDDDDDDEGMARRPVAVTLR